MDWAGVTTSNTSEFGPHFVVRKDLSGILESPSADFRLRLEGGNPFRSATAFACELPAPGDAALRIYDAAGRLVRELELTGAGQGVHRIRWNGRNEAERPVPAGVYLAELRYGERRTGIRIVKLD
jgi:hypothetical protein